MKVLRDAAVKFAEWRRYNRGRLWPTANVIFAGVFLAWLAGYNFDTRDITVALWAALILLICAVTWNNN